MSGWHTRVDGQFFQIEVLSVRSDEKFDYLRQEASKNWADYYIPSIIHMHDYLVAVLFGVVQGLTEFLPVSSSGHLVLLHELLPVDLGDNIAFDLMLHAATLTAVCVYLYRDIVALSSGLWQKVLGRDNSEGRLAILLVFTTIPAALAGLLFEEAVENVLRSPFVVAFMLMTVAFVLLWADRRQGTLELNSLRSKHAWAIGLAQSVALIPGTSRSGITIIAGLFAGLKKEAAVRYSFLASAPLIAGAFISKLPEIMNTTVAWSIMLVGFVSAALSAYFSLALLERVARVSFRYFAYYRVALAVVVFLFFWLR